MNVDLSLRTTEKFLRSDFATMSKTHPQEHSPPSFPFCPFQKGSFPQAEQPSTDGHCGLLCWEYIQMLQSQATIQNAWRGIHGRELVFLFVLVFWGFLPQALYYKWHPKMRTQFVCLSAGTCCAVSESHTLQHGAI